MRQLTLFLFLLLTVLDARGQDFAFAFAPSRDRDDDIEPVRGYKLAVTQKVFDALLRARGDYRMQKPSLVINRKEGRIACFRPDLVQVILDEKAYDLCATFGKDSLNALASILAHELIHYYEKHEWSRNFVQDNEDFQHSRHLENLDEKKRQETQADFIGGFLAFSVGYNTYGIMPEFLKKAYKAYDLSEDLPGYPSLTNRLAMSEDAMKSLQELQIVFETANYLTMLGNYAEAARYHTRILKTYQSREIFNNAGVNAALAGMALLNPNEMPFVLPLELDPKSRLISLKNNDWDKEARRNVLLRLALDEFERAVVLDETYTTGYLNKACVLALLGEWDDADETIRKGKKKSPSPQIASDFLVLEGVIAALQKDSLAAMKLWEQAQKQGNPWAKVNIATLQNNSRHAMNAIIPAKGLEEIEQYELAGFLLKPQPDRTVEVEPKIHCGFSQLKQSRLFIHYANKGKEYVLIQETQPNYSGLTLRGIGLGATQDKVEEAYGKAPRNVAILGGIVWVYPDSNIFFRFSPQDKVESWGVYRDSSR